LEVETQLKGANGIHKQQSEILKRQLQAILISGMGVDRFKPKKRHLPPQYMVMTGNTPPTGDKQI